MINQIPNKLFVSISLLLTLCACSLHKSSEDEEYLNICVNRINKYFQDINDYNVVHGFSDIAFLTSFENTNFVEVRFESHKIEERNVVSESANSVCWLDSVTNKIAYLDVPKKDYGLERIVIIDWENVNIDELSMIINDEDSKNDERKYMDINSLFE